MKKLLFAVSLLPLAVFAQGNLTPPGPPAPTMKTLQQIEPRTPISSLPFTINQPGSYYITTNLTGVSGQSGIIISARNVTLDLNGFELVGVAGASSGIFTGPLLTNLTVRNGTVRNWPALGLAVASAAQGRYENLTLLQNTSGGISAGVGAIVSDCNFERNGNAAASTALRTGSGSSVRNCSVRNSAGEGIRVGYGSSVMDCVVEESGSTGLFTDESCTVRGCAVTLSGLAGIDAGSGSTLEANTAGYNGDAGIVANDGSTIRNCASYANTFEGILLINGGAIESCTARLNGSGGINAGRDSTLQNCTVTSNTGHGILGSTNVVVKNCVVSRSTRNGIQLDDNSIIAHCTSSLNSSNGIDVAVSCAITDSVANGNSRYGIVANARCRVADNTANNNGSFMVSGAGFYFLGDDNHIEGNNAVHNYIGYLIDGSFNFVVKNKASDFFPVNGGFVLDLGANREAPIVNDPTAAQPWSNIAY